jgi:ribose transport system substrate-binding protein
MYPIIAGALSGLALGIIPALRPVSRPREITFIPRTSGTLPLESMYQGASRAARESGFRLYWNAPTREDDVDRQLKLMSSALDSGTSGLILVPTNSLALTTIINKFISHRIPIVFVQTDAPIPTGPYVTSVAPDEVEVSRLAAKRILGAAGAGGEIAIVGLNRTVPETLERARNFTEEMRTHPEIKIVVQQRGTSLVPEAEQNAGEVLDRLPHLKAILAVSAMATEGAVLAIQKRGLGKKVMLVGCDDYLALRNDLREGRIDSAVVADSNQMGYLAAKTLLQSIEHHTLSGPQNVSVRLLTRENANAQNEP